MNVQGQIKDYINSQPESKRSDMQTLHRIILELMPACRLWFLDGKNSENKTVSNPNIGYGLQTIKYADGTSREFYQIGMSANTYMSFLPFAFSLAISPATFSFNKMELFQSTESRVREQTILGRLFMKSAISP